MVYILYYLYFCICYFFFLPMSTLPYSLQDICPSFMPRRLLTCSVGRAWALGTILSPDLRSIPNLLCDPMLTTLPLWFVSARLSQWARPMVPT